MLSVGASEVEFPLIWGQKKCLCSATNPSAQMKEAVNIFDQVKFSVSGLIPELNKLIRPVLTTKLQN